MSFYFIAHEPEKKQMKHKVTNFSLFLIKRKNKKDYAKKKLRLSQTQKAGQEAELVVDGE